MVNYSWGDVWDERQKQDDIKRFYGPNSSGGSYPVKPYGGGYSYRSPRSRHSGRNLAIVFVILLVAGSGLAYAFNVASIQTYTDSLINPIAKSVPEDVPTTGTKTTPVVTTTTTPKSVKHIEYVTEQETKVLLDRGVFLSNGGDSTTFDFQVPNKDVTYMTGTIAVQGSKYVHVEFTDTFGSPYCSSCKFDVYGSNVKEVKIAVDAGDSLVVKVTNPDDADLQTVNLKLSVTYSEQKEKITYETIEEPAAPATTTQLSQPTVPSPIMVYTNCDFGIMEQGSRASCEQPSFKVFLLETTPKLQEVLAKAGFRIGDAPLTAIFRGVTVEQYDEKNFVIIIKDAVSEKHYPTQLWELPS